MKKEIFYSESGILNKNKIKELWVKNNHIDDYYIIMQLSKTIEYRKFSQLLYHYVNGMNENIKCLYCDSINLNFLGFSVGYSTGCSRSCNIQLSRPKSNETRKVKTMYKYGVSHTSQLEHVKNKMLKTNQERYGTDAPAQNCDIMQKINTIK